MLHGTYSPGQVWLFIAFAATSALSIYIAAGYPLLTAARLRGRREALTFTASEPGMRETDDADAHMAGWFGSEPGDDDDPATAAAALLRRLSQ